MAVTFDPIYEVVTRCRVPNIVPLYEHFADDPIVEKVMGYDFSKTDTSTSAGQLELWKQRITFYQQMGYGYVPIEMGPRFAPRENLISDDTALYSRGSRGWVDEHGGIISGMADWRIHRSGPKVRMLLTIPCSRPWPNWFQMV